MQKIEIHQLGSVKEFISDLLDMNLLIGEQATGKSTICKSVYFFRIIKEEIIAYLYDIATDRAFEKSNRIPKVLNKRTKDIFLQLFGVSWYLDEKLRMRYDYANGIYIEVSLSPEKYLEVQYSPSLCEHLRTLERELATKRQDIGRMDFSFVAQERTRINKEIRNRVNAIFDDYLSTYYIPAGRQLLALLSRQKTKIDYDSIDLVNRRFVQFNESIQSYFDHGIENLHEYYPSSNRDFSVGEMAGKIIRGLKGDYRNTKSGEYLVVNEEQKVPINYASSGQQELLWLLNQLYILMLRQESAFVIIEEPEAHIYPSLQKAVFEFITEFINVNKSKALVTTHSPYILTVANVLYYGGRLARDIPDAANDDFFKKTLSATKLLSPKKFTAWKLEEDGSAQSLVDEEYEDLRSSLIDGVSDEIERLYSKLYYYEVEHEEEQKGE